MADLILPSLNEEGGLAWLLPRLPEGIRPVVVDNGSTDATAQVAHNYGATVVRAEQRGFGAACWAGLQHSTADVVAFMDADATLDPQQLHRVLRPVLQGQADLVLGARVPQPGSWPMHARLANRVLARAITKRTGQAFTDLGPMRAARRTALLSLDLQDRRSGWPLEMLLKAVSAGWRCVEVPVDYLPRKGTSKVTGTSRGSLQAVRDMRRELQRHSA